MNWKTILRSGGASVLVAALALPSVPGAAQDDRRGPRAEARERGAPVTRGHTIRQRSEPQREQVQPARQRAQRDQVRQAPQQVQREQRRADIAQQRGAREWNRSDRRSETGAERSGRDWNRGDRRSETRSGAEWNRAMRPGQPAVPGSEPGRRGQVEQAMRSERNRSYRDGDRNRSYRDGWRDRRGTDQRRDWRGDRGEYRDGNRDYREGRRDYRDDRWRDHRRWSRDWRRDQRYDWYSYRSQYRDRYRLGRYYAPYRNYRYNRLSIGFFLGNGFYSSRYWINDPWHYRLPPAYGSLRWVRYYDDALLVDIYSGEVVDVIYDFFW